MPDFGRTILRSPHVAEYDALDVMWATNPELTGLVYAHHEEVLSEDIMPHLAKFRLLQTREKVALLNHIAERARIASGERMHDRDADVRVHEIDTGYLQTIRLADIQAGMHHDEQITSRYGIDADVRMNDRNALSGERIASTEQRGMTDRTRIEADNAYKMHCMKYETRRRILESQFARDKYLSDNELRAIHIEAEANRDIAKFTEQMRRDVAHSKITADLSAQIHAAEKQYLTRLAEAESDRRKAVAGHRSEVIVAYLQEQSKIVRAAAFGEIERARIRAGVEKHTYDLIHSLAKEGVRLLERPGTHSVMFRGETPYGPINLEIGVNING